VGLGTQLGWTRRFITLSLPRFPYLCLMLINYRAAVFGMLGFLHCAARLSSLYLLWFTSGFWVQRSLWEASLQVWTLFTSVGSLCNFMKFPHYGCACMWGRLLFHSRFSYWKCGSEISSWYLTDSA
jgi:hypothetical protein